MRVRADLRPAEQVTPTPPHSPAGVDCHYLGPALLQGNEVPNLHGMAWHGMAWHGMAWHGMAWHGMAWHGAQGGATLPCQHRLLTPAIAASSEPPLGPMNLAEIILTRQFTPTIPCPLDAAPMMPAR
jgi:hypothetical protein